MTPDNPVPDQDAPAQHPAVGDRYTCRTQDGIRSVTVTRVWDLGDGATVAIEWPGSGGEHRMSLDVFTGASRRLCSTPGPEASICDLPAGHTGRHEELGYGRLITWATGQPADGAAREEQQDPAPDDTCRVVEVDGEPVRVRGAGETTEQGRAALAGIIGAAHRRHAAEQARHDAQVRATALREAADLAHMEGARLYDEAGQRQAQGAWAVRDELRARAAQLDPTPAAERTIAYRAARSGYLFCLRCGTGGGLTALTSEDLPDGGLCGDCDTDVFAVADEISGHHTQTSGEQA